MRIFHIISREATVSSFLATINTLLLICRKCESEQVLIIFIIAFELNRAVFQLVRNKSESAARFLYHEVDCGDLHKAEKFVQELLNDNLEVKI